VEETFAGLADELRAEASTRPLYLRLAERLAASMAAGRAELPPARALAAGLGLNRATVTAAYRELARQGLVVLRPGRPGRRSSFRPGAAGAFEGPPESTLDLARYVPDRSLLPEGKVLRWLGFGGGEGESVAQYGDAHGYPPLRQWLQERLRRWGIAGDREDIVVTSGVQHGLDLLLRALARPGDAVLVEDPTYPGLPPLLAIHRLRPVGVPLRRSGVNAEDLIQVVRRERPRLAVLTPTLQNPSGTVLDDGARDRILDGLCTAGVTVIEELFDPELVVGGEVPRPLAARDAKVIAVSSFSKVLFPGLRVGWVSGPRETMTRLAAVKRATDLSGSSFLEATALSLCRRGQLEAQTARLRAAAAARLAIVHEALAGASDGVGWSEPRGGFSLVIELPDGISSRAVAARAAALGVWVLPGPLMSVSGRDDVLRLAFAAVGGERLRDGVARVMEAVSAPASTLAMV
jgi:DNA-binding transcriptional MocR family regulator